MYEGQNASQYAGWTDEILRQARNHEKPLLVGIYRGIIIPGFLGGGKISSSHSRRRYLYLLRSGQ